MISAQVLDIAAGVGCAGDEEPEWPTARASTSSPSASACTTIADSRSPSLRLAAEGAVHRLETRPACAAARVRLSHQPAQEDAPALPARDELREVIHARARWRSVQVCPAPSDADRSAPRPRRSEARPCPPWVGRRSGSRRTDQAPRGLGQIEGQPGDMLPEGPPPHPRPPHPAAQCRSETDRSSTSSTACGTATSSRLDHSAINSRRVSWSEYWSATLRISESRCAITRRQGDLNGHLVESSAPRPSPW